MLKKLLLVAALAATFPLQAVVTQIEVWADDNGNIRYLLPDVHIDYIDKKITHQQHQAILWAAQQKKIDGIFVIAEDMTHHGLCNDQLAKLYKHTASLIKAQTTSHNDTLKIIEASPLWELVNNCLKNNIPVYNAECWQGLMCRHYNPSEFSDVDMQENFILNISELDSTIPLLSSYSQQLSAQFANDDQELKSKVVNTRNDLLEAKTIHQLIRWKNLSYGIIIEGTFHIKNIKKHLLALGYKHVRTIGQHSYLDLIMLPSVILLPLTIKNALDLKKEFAELFAQHDAQKKETAAKAAQSAAALADVKQQAAASAAVKLRSKL